MSESDKNLLMRTCWIESFIKTFENIPSPEIFVKWCAITTVGAALARRCYATTAGKKVYPNIYCLLVAPPGVGKTQGITEAVEIAHKVPKMKVAPDDTTKASLLDAMEGALEVEILSPTDMFQHNSMFLGIDELGTMLSSYDPSMMSTLIALYDNRNTYKETRRAREEPLTLHNPQLSMLAGTQPSFLASMLPDHAWEGGFMARMLMVYHGRPKRISLFGEHNISDTRPLIAGLSGITELFGEFEWTQEAQEFISHWYDGGMQPVPQHSKLKHYNSRRLLYVIKLSMISNAARTNELVVDKLDIERAIDWIVEIEKLMPEIFKDMVGKSDNLVIQDLHGYLWQIGTKTNGDKQVFHRSKMEIFLMQRTPAYNIENIIKLCLATKIIIDKGADMFEVGNRNSTGE